MWWILGYRLCPIILSPLLSQQTYFFNKNYFFVKQIAPWAFGSNKKFSSPTLTILHKSLFEREKVSKSRGGRLSTHGRLVRQKLAIDRPRFYLSLIHRPHWPLGCVYTLPTKIFWHPFSEKVEWSRLLNYNNGDHVSLSLFLLLYSLQLSFFSFFSFLFLSVSWLPLFFVMGLKASYSNFSCFFIQLKSLWAL